MNWGGDRVLSDEVALGKLDFVNHAAFGGLMMPPHDFDSVWWTATLPSPCGYRDHHMHELGCNSDEI